MWLREELRPSRPVADAHGGLLGCRAVMKLLNLLVELTGSVSIASVLGFEFLGTRGLGFPAIPPL